MVRMNEEDNQQILGGFRGSSRQANRGACAAGKAQRAVEAAERLRTGLMDPCFFICCQILWEECHDEKQRAFGSLIETQLATLCRRRLWPLSPERLLLIRRNTYSMTARMEDIFPAQGTIVKARGCGVFHKLLTNPVLSTTQSCQPVVQHCYPAFSFKRDILQSHKSFLNRLPFDLTLEIKETTGPRWKQRALVKIMRLVGGLEVFNWLHN